MASTRDIITAVLFGDSYTTISTRLKCSRRDISAAHKLIDTHQITLHSLSQITDEELEEWKNPLRGLPQESKYLAPDFATTLHRLKTNPHHTLLLDWRYYLVEAGSAAKQPYSYSHYCQRFHAYVDTHDLYRTLHHQPGRTMQVDWAGDTIKITDRITGQARKVYFFTAVLPYSSMMYVHPSFQMDIKAWLNCHIAALRYFGGAPFVLVPDNDTAAIYRPKKNDPARAVSAEYEALAKFYNTAVMPTDVRAPKHKAGVERSVQIAYSRILGVLEMEGPFHSIDQIEDIVADQVHEINYDIVRVDGTRRIEQFQAEERHLLIPLPDQDYTSYEWKELKVQRNYHISCDKQYYSVPWKLVGSTVKARLSNTEITVFAGDQVVAIHRRLQGRFGQYSTHADHVPPAHLDTSDLWSDQWFINQARLVGPATTTVIEMMINRHAHHAHGWLDCQNVLKTLGGKSRSGLEQACQELLDADLYPTYSVIKKLQSSIIAHRDTHKRSTTGSAPTPAPDLVKPQPVKDLDAGVFLRSSNAYEVDDIPSLSFDDDQEGNQ